MFGWRQSKLLCINFKLGEGGGEQNVAKEANVSLKEALIHIVF